MTVLNKIDEVPAVPKCSSLYECRDFRESQDTLVSYESSKFGWGSNTGSKEVLPEKTVLFDSEFWENQIEQVIGVLSLNPSANVFFFQICFIYSAFMLTSQFLYFYFIYRSFFELSFSGICPRFLIVTLMCVFAKCTSSRTP